MAIGGAFNSADIPPDIHTGSKRAIQPTQHDIPLTLVFGVIGGVAVIILIGLIWFLHRRAKRDKIGERKVDLLENYSYGEPVDIVIIEKPLPQPPSATTMRFSVINSRDGSALLGPQIPPPAYMTADAPVPKRYIAGPVRSPESRRPARPFDTPQMGHARSISDITTSSTHLTAFSNGLQNRRTSSVAPAPSEVDSLVTTGRFTIVNVPEREKAPYPSDKKDPFRDPLPDQLDPPPLYQSRSIRKMRPPSIVVPRGEGKGKRTLNVPATPSTDEWSPGPLATPTTAYTVQIPVPASTRRPLPRNVTSPITITASYPVSNITVEDIESIRSGPSQERRGRVVKLAVHLDDDEEIPPRQQDFARTLLPDPDSESQRAGSSRQSVASYLPPYVPSHDYERH